MNHIRIYIIHTVYSEPCTECILAKCSTVGCNIVPIDFPKKKTKTEEYSGDEWMTNKVAK